MRQRKNIVGIILLFFGVIVCLIGTGFLIYYVEKKSDCTLEVTGTVVDLDVSYNNEDGIYSEAYAPVFRYKMNGVERTETYSIHSNPCSYEIGDEVDLLVDPFDGSNFMVVGSIWMQLTAGICLGVGFVLVVIAFIVLRAGKNSVRKNSFQQARKYQYNPNTFVPSANKRAQTNTYNLNGEWHQSAQIEQPGYYNLNGKIVKSKDPNE